jgi:hypothetical protein
VLDPVRGVTMDTRPVGRDGEIAEISAFLSATSDAPAALAITGDAGIGKTVVWKHVAQAAGRSPTPAPTPPPAPGPASSESLSPGATSEASRRAGVASRARWPRTPRRR